MDGAVQHPLDNVVWSALTGPHARWAQRRGLAVRYPEEMAPFCAIADDSKAALQDLATLTVGADRITLFRTEPVQPGAAFRVLRAAEVRQMVKRLDGESSAPFEVASLDERDVAAMIDLAEETKPGPFRLRTREMGRYVGVCRDGRLVAMAGERMRLDDHVEISAVCTRATHRGMGFAACLVQRLSADIESRGATPFLHVFADNPHAIGLYESLGFVVRRTLHATVLRPAPQ